MKRLIVNADDFGLTRGINRGIIEAHRRGILTSATLMVNMPACEEAAKLASENRGLGVGLHLTLIDGRPVSEPRRVPTLVDASGAFLQRPAQLLKLMALGRVDPDQIRIELSAQIEKGMKLLAEITHLDVHKHLHFHPLVLDALLRLAREYGIKRIRWPREAGLSLRQVLTVKAANAGGAMKQFLVAKAISALFAAQERKILWNGILKPDRCYGIAHTGFIDIDALLRMIGSVQEGVSELICHPGYDTEELNLVRTRLRSERERELKALIDPKAMAAIRAARIELISYRDLN